MIHPQAGAKGSRGAIGGGRGAGAPPPAANHNASSHAVVLVSRASVLSAKMKEVRSFLCFLYVLRVLLSFVWMGGRGLCCLRALRVQTNRNPTTKTRFLAHRHLERPSPKQNKHKAAKTKRLHPQVAEQQAVLLRSPRTTVSPRVTCDGLPDASGTFSLPLTAAGSLMATPSTSIGGAPEVGVCLLSICCFSCCFVWNCMYQKQAE